MENNEVPLVMLSVSAEDDGGLTFQSGFSQLLGDEMTDDERTQVNAVIDQLLDLLEPIFMRVADEAFEDNGEDDEDE
ncbi:MAG: hypothetical protein ABI874_09115 [Chloroflexota bacterium]